ncbi:hypothetical protein BZF66_04995 [Salmonella enterica]|nr:hypothetical protein CPT_Munch_363 [Salmonella phage Munch]EAR2661120.1 hypothetical protein [Salmonella enterica]MCP0435618.1 hypothetical protein [Salmonella enterica subsp. enterica serovar Mbandaka]EAZ2022657.1 hypothetical protein [Salmonella enterica]ECC6867421.1 hypothetical protein [Salmonella enterica]
MKGKYFFIENRKEIEIAEFDYKYVRNAFLKEYDRSANRKYCYTVIVSRTYDPTGEPIFDVRVLDLNDIYFDNTRLRMLEVMIDEIGFANKPEDRRIQNLPMPPLQKEYQEYLEGKKRKAVVTEVSNQLIEVPPPPELKRVPVAEDDSRIMAVEAMFSDNDVEVKPLVVLDWVDNFPIANHEVTVKMRNMTEKQIKMASSISAHSEYLHGVMNNIGSVLEEIFPVNPGFFKKVFGNTDFKIEKKNVDSVIERLTNAVKIDSRRFAGLQTNFDEIKEMASEIKENLEQGVMGCKYAVASIEDAYEFDIREERLMKMGIVANQTRASMMEAEMKFNMDMERFNEIQTVLLPILVIRIQSSANSKLDDDTVKIIRNIAKKD